MTNNMKIWITTDTHLGHDAMISYCGRPKNHSELILVALRENVKEGDTLIHLGDICMGADDAWHLDLAGYLPKDIVRILIKGNHDKKSTNWYMNHGWNLVFDKLPFSYNGKRILFSHIPERKQKFDDLDLNIHGHFHNNAHRMEGEVKGFYNPEYHKLLAIENTDYKPVTLDSLL